MRDELVLDDRELAIELDRLTDSHTELIASSAAGYAAATPWVFENKLSRLVVDPERFLDETEEMSVVGMGAVYTHTSRRSRLRTDNPHRTSELIAAYYTPYAAAMSNLVDARLAATGSAVVLDIHSYPTVALPYELHGNDQRPAICLGTDSFHTPSRLLEVATAVFTPLGAVATNTPFAGCYVPRQHYRRTSEVLALMIEIRRDLYLDQTGSPTVRADALAAALGELVDAMS